MSANDILLQLEASSSTPVARRTFQHYADLFFRHLLEYADFPEDYFSLLLEVLSRPNLFSVEGAETFLYQTYASRDALSPKQREKLFELLVDQYPSYTKSQLCLVAADFLSRGYPPAVALGAIERMSSKVKTTEQSNGLLMALDILSKADIADSEFQMRRKRAHDGIILNR